VKPTNRIALFVAVSALTAFAQKPPMTQDQKMQWFREAKFGLFIHWGLYSIPAGEWNGKPVAGIGEWIMNRAKIPVGEYEKLAGQFNPTKFDAEASPNSLKTPA
jgi:alpha-L-fucosidase